MQFVRTAVQDADVLTKALPVTHHKTAAERLGLVFNDEFRVEGECWSIAFPCMLGRLATQITSLGLRMQYSWFWFGFRFGATLGV